MSLESEGIYPSSAVSMLSFQLSVRERKSERSSFSPWRSNESWWGACCQRNSDGFFIRLWCFNHSAPSSSHRWLPPDQCALLSALRAKGRSMALCHHRWWWNGGLTLLSNSRQCHVFFSPSLLKLVDLDAEWFFPVRNILVSNWCVTFTGLLNLECSLAVVWELMKSSSCTWMNQEEKELKVSRSQPPQPAALPVITLKFNDGH